MNWRSVLAGVGLLAVLGVPWRAAAGGGTEVEPGDTAFTVSAAGESGGSSTASAQTSSTDPVVSSFESSMCAIGGQETCGELALCDNGDVMTYTTYVTESGAVLEGSSNCPQDAVAAGPPVVTPGLVLAAFRRVPLPASELGVQPPGGRTLVNFETNFFTDDGGFTRVVRLLGQRVVLRIWPASFGWRFGDGASRETVSAGSPYPDLEVTHRYLDRGRVAARVDTTYAAEFSVNGGPWREVGGTVTIPGDPEGLRVVTARPVLVGD
jgi:hypothetical protein